MDNCFVTQLNGVTSCKNLPVLGAIRVMFTGTGNNNGNSIAGNFTLQGSDVEWKGEGTCNIGTPIAESAYNVKPAKDAKGLLLIKDKSAVSMIDSTWNYGTNVMLADINKYCENLKSLGLSNTEQDGDLSQISDLSQLTYIGIGSSKVTGSISALGCLDSLESLDISKNNKVSLDLADLSNCLKLKELHLDSSSAIGDLKSLANCVALTSISAHSTGITGSISSLANNANFISFNHYTLKNTWGNSTLRPSSMPKIMGNFKFSSASDTDNFLINMASCSDTGIKNKSWYFQQSHRTSASDSAVTTLQNAGYSLNQLVKD